MMSKQSIFRADTDSHRTLLSSFAVDLSTVGVFASDWLIIDPQR